MDSPTISSYNVCQIRFRVTFNKTLFGKNLYKEFTLGDFISNSNWYGSWTSVLYKNGKIAFESSFNSGTTIFTTKHFNNYIFLETSQKSLVLKIFTYKFKKLPICDYGPPQDHIDSYNVKYIDILDGTYLQILGEITKQYIKICLPNRGTNIDPVQGRDERDSIEYLKYSKTNVFKIRISIPILNMVKIDPKLHNNIDQIPGFDRRRQSRYFYIVGDLIIIVIYDRLHDDFIYTTDNKSNWNISLFDGGRQIYYNRIIFDVIRNKIPNIIFDKIYNLVNKYL